MGGGRWPVGPSRPGRALNGARLDFSVSVKGGAARRMSRPFRVISSRACGAVRRSWVVCGDWGGTRWLERTGCPIANEEVGR